MTKKITFSIVLVLIACSICIYLIKKNETSASTCDSGTNATVLCYQDQLKSVVLNQDVNAGFSYIKDLYSQNLIDGGACHSLAHKIGEIAYGDTEQGDKININLNANICGYGFYHGFMEALIIETGDFEKAKNFCDQLHSESDVSQESKSNCYHGIGHGATVAHELKNIDQITTLAREGNSWCENITKADSQERMDCLIGVYGGIADNISPLAKMEPGSDYNPIEFCEKQLAEYQEPCLISFGTVVLDIEKRDFQNALNSVRTQSKNLLENDLFIHGIAVSYAFSNAIEVSQNFNQTINLCSSLPAKIACLKGILTGLKQSSHNPQESIDQIALLCSQLQDHDSRALCTKESK